MIHDVSLCPIVSLFHFYLDAHLIIMFICQRIIPFHEITAVRRAKAAAIFPTAIEIVAGGKKVIPGSVMLCYHAICLFSSFQINTYVEKCWHAFCKCSTFLHPSCLEMKLISLSMMVGYNTMVQLKSLRIWCVVTHLAWPFITCIVMLQYEASPLLPHFAYCLQLINTLFALFWLVNNHDVSYSLCYPT